MEIREQSERETCHVIVFGRDGADVLLKSTETGFILPSVEVPRWQRLAENLTSALKQDWGCDAVCLFTPNHSSQDRNTNGHHYEVMECWRDQHVRGTDWKPFRSLTTGSFQNAAEFRVLEQCLHELENYERNPSSPFARRGWLTYLREWTADVVCRLGFELTGPFRQYNAGPAFSLIRFETTGPAIWFKAVGEPNLREYPITLKLAELFPRFIPEMLATKPEWNGWLSAEIEGTNLGDRRDVALWKKAATDLARLQIESISRSDSILGSGAHDLRANKLLTSIDPFFELVAQLMEEQPKVPPATLSRRELSMLKLRIEDSLALLEDLRFPTTVGHLDLNPWNIVVSTDGCVFLDWAEAYFGPPFFSFEYLLQHFRHETGADAVLESAFVDAYKAPWRQLLTDDLISAALTLAPLAAVFAYAAGTGAWKTKERLRDPKTGAYFRSVARRMNREAIRFIEREVGMPQLATAPPYSSIEPVTEILHGVTITDPYRWLEDQDSPRTREWLLAQQQYARSYLDSIAGRDRIRKRIRELLDVETYDSIQKVGQRYFFRKRLPGQEQPCVYFREGANGADRLLIDPAERGTGRYTAVKPLRVSQDGRLLLYEVKQGGERTGTFEILEIETRTILPDVLPRGHLRGFAFAPGGRSFCYVHEEVEAKHPYYRAAYHHTLGTASSKDQEIFFAGEGRMIRLALFGDESFLVFFVYRFEKDTFTEVYAKPFHPGSPPELLWAGTTQLLGLHFLGDRILALTDSGAPNRRIIEAREWHAGKATWTELISETDKRIENWWVVGNEIVLCYGTQTDCQVHVFDLSGKKMREIPLPSEDTVRVFSAPDACGELLVETQSFTKPVAILRYDIQRQSLSEFARMAVPFESANYTEAQVWFTSRDGTTIPMYLVARRDVLEKSSNPTVMTAYGGYGASMTPRFSIFVASLLERGCLFAMPSIRGGSEFGQRWHDAARRRNRQTAYDDFLSAVEWLISTERTCPGQLAIFGGSNAGLLVAAAMTQRPDLLRAVVCMSPLADMLRYHLFDDAHVWRDEFGTADEPKDFAALAGYSPYHRVLEGESYPATMIVSGDADGNCNPLHARKMTARLQASNRSDHVIFLDYHAHRGHSAVLPLSDRIEALTDRIAFLCDQLQLSV